jgi:hypothetical protein
MNAMSSQLDLNAVTDQITFLYRQHLLRKYTRLHTHTHSSDALLGTQCFLCALGTLAQWF